MFSLQLDPEVRIRPPATMDLFFVAKAIAITGTTLSPQTIVFDA